MVPPRLIDGTIPLPSGTAPPKASTLSRAKGAPVSTSTCGPGWPFTSTCTENTPPWSVAGSGSPCSPSHSGGMASEGDEHPATAARTAKIAAAGPMRARSEIIATSNPGDEPKMKSLIRREIGAAGGRFLRKLRILCKRRREEASHAQGAEARVIDAELDIAELETAVGLARCRARCLQLDAGDFIPHAHTDPRIDGHLTGYSEKFSQCEVRFESEAIVLP